MQVNIFRRIRPLISYVFIIGVGLLFGLMVKESLVWLNAPSEYIYADTKPHFINAESEIIIYTTSWCPYCKQLKQYLAEKNISFDNRDIETGNDKVKELFASIGDSGVPKIVIGNKIINGFNITLLTNELSQLQTNK